MRTQMENIVQIPTIELYPPEFHPFNVEDNDELKKLVESIRENGISEPCIARKRDEGGFELLCGNRRKMACEMLGIETLPVIVRELDDKQAVDVQVDSNLLHRERILPSEKAWAYRLKMETLNHNGKKSAKYSHEILTEQTGESKNQIFRYIRLTELVPDLMDKVDERKIAFNPAVELSYLSRSEQNIVNIAIEKYDTKPTLS
ncbi:MAG: ParB/RepB/Spo0J family partition protein, partial [Ruminococcus sp.]|nr:ParB/RepB/Spo0J family partition protein [Ruminococcus sp.]